jgi:hypothetical protein
MWVPSREGKILCSFYVDILSPEVYCDILKASIYFWFHVNL